MTNEEWIQKLAKACGNTMKDNKLLTSVAIAQAILEAGWFGKSELASKYNNYHGLNNYDDEVTMIYDKVAINVPQYRDGKWVYNVEYMCKFDRIEQSFECLMRWYTMRDRYKYIVGNTDYIAVCNYLTGKFATDPTYGSKLIQLIETYSLTRFDRTDSSADTGMYYVQAGAYESKDNAKKQMKKLEKAGFASLLKYDEVFYRVQCGAYSVRDNAVKQVNNLLAAGFPAIIKGSMGKEVK